MCSSHSLDPDNDPLCVLLMIDYFALRASEHKFLIRLCDEWEVCNKLLSVFTASHTGIIVTSTAVPFSRVTHQNAIFKSYCTLESGKR